MGLGQSRLGDRYYRSHEKAFERIETDLQKLQTRMYHRKRRQAVVGVWSASLVGVALLVACYLIYQTQQRQYPFREHFERVAGAMALPAGAAALHWALLALLGVLDRRVGRRIKYLEDAKRAMIKELKDASAYERTKALIDKYDPDARRLPPPVLQMAHPGGAGGAVALRGQPGGKPQMSRPGHMAGAAAAAVGSAGMALVPLIDKLAATLIADNPVLLEDLRRAQGQLEEAQRQAQEAARESTSLRCENAVLKANVAQLEAALGIAPPPGDGGDGGGGDGDGGEGGGEDPGAGFQEEAAAGVAEAAAVELPWEDGPRGQEQALAAGGDSSEASASGVRQRVGRAAAE